MKQFQKLSRAEMKSIAGGNPPSCTVGCYAADGEVVTVTIANYPVGSGCSQAPLTSYCPAGYWNYISCECQSGGSLPS